jgi:hypothetical protein
MQWGGGIICRLIPGQWGMWDICIIKATIYVSPLSLSLFISQNYWNIKISNQQVLIYKVFKSTLFV